MTLRTLLRMIVITLMLLTSWLHAASFKFNKNEAQWYFWGEGLGKYDERIGHESPGSLWLSTDWGETQTTHFRWNDLKPGIYHITFYVRAQDVQKGQDGSSFWHFYDTGDGTESIYTDLYGNYEWRKVEYSVKVKDKGLSLWFRLRSPGQVWIDDFALDSGSEFKKLSISHPLPLKRLSIEKKPSSPKTNLLLYGFEAGTKEKNHPFQIVKLNNGHVGKFNSQDYFKFPITKMLKGNWTGYDRIEMDILNPYQDFMEIYVTLKDKESSNYWSQLNHKGSLAQGWNHLSFSLKQYVGERGSHRFHRGLNLKSLQDFFIVIDPDRKMNKRNGFLIDNVKLTSNPYPEVPKGIYAFDFTSQKSDGESSLTKVTSQHLFEKERGFGFQNPQFWRIEDSRYASELFRYSIGVLKGKFIVNLPNGRYQLQLIADNLGYWDVPFWKDRTIEANGKPIYKETRSNAVDYLSDLLRFESVFPAPGDHPYDLYLSKIFRPINATVDVTHGSLVLEFSGDPSGISLNSLIIWQEKDKEMASHFLKKLDERNKQEFDWMSRAIDTPKSPKIKKIELSVVKPDLLLGPDQKRKSISRRMIFQGGEGEAPYQLLQMRGGEKSLEVSWQLNELKSKEGGVIPGEDIKVSDVIFQYTSPDLNHETYMLAGKYLKPFNEPLLKIKKHTTRYLWFQLRILNNYKKGTYNGEISFIADNDMFKIPISLTIMSYKLPKVEFPVGFFGLDPIPYTYFDGNEISSVRSHYRLQALEMLGKAGFTTFTGLPPAKLSMEGDFWDIDTTELDELFENAKKWGMVQTVFSYGGQFPQHLLDESLRPGDMNPEMYHSKISEILTRTLSVKDWPKIVHTFSDEAGGYSNKIQEDIDKGISLKKHYPFLALGGFGSLGNKDTKKLHDLFEFGFYSHLEKKELESLKNKWGSYNAAPGNLHDPRFSFGPGLFVAREAGLSHFLEWHAAGFNNYPFYELDGRESDVTMFMPSIDGNVYPTLRFEFATEGLHSYRKMKLLRQLVKQGKGSRDKRSLAENWLKKIKEENDFFSSPIFLQKRDMNFEMFKKELDHHLTQLDQ